MNSDSFCLRADSAILNCPGSVAESPKGNTRLVTDTMSVLSETNDVGGVGVPLVPSPRSGGAGCSNGESGGSFVFRDLPDNDPEEAELLGAIRPQVPNARLRRTANLNIPFFFSMGILFCCFRLEVVEAFEFEIPPEYPYYGLAFLVSLFFESIGWSSATILWFCVLILFVGVWCMHRDDAGLARFAWYHLLWITTIHIVVSNGSDIFMISWAQHVASVLAKWYWSVEDVPQDEAEVRYVVEAQSERVTVKKLKLTKIVRPTRTEKFKREVQVYYKYTLSLLAGKMYSWLQFLDIPNSSFDWKSILEECVYYLVSIFRAETHQVLAASLQFFKSITGKSPIALIMDQIQKRVSGLCNIVEAQSGMDRLKDMLNDFDAFRQSPIWTKMYQLGVFVLISGFLERFGISFSSLGYNAMEERMMRKNFHATSADMLSALGHSLHYFCETGYVIYKTGDISAIYHSGGEYVNKYMQVTKLRNDITQIVAGLSKEDELRVASEAEEVLADLKKRVDHAKRLSKSDCLPLFNLYNSLFLSVRELRASIIARGSRKAPFVLQVYGDSGVGKTSVANYLFQVFGLYAQKYFPGLERDFGKLYKRESNQEFWSAFSWNQWAIILDDIASINPKASQGVDESLKEILLLMNNVPYITNQADLESKGKIPAQPLLVIGTTNSYHLNLASYFSNFEAVARRFPYIIVPILRKEFKGPNGMLKLPENYLEGGKVDFWKFTVLERVFVDFGDHRSLKTNTVLSEVDLPVFEKWLQSAIDAWFHSQKNYENTRDLLATVQLCEQCQVSNLVCPCANHYDITTEEVEAQSMTMAVIFMTFGMMLKHFWDSFDQLLAYVVKCWFRRKLHKFRLFLASKIEGEETERFWDRYGASLQRFHETPSPLVYLGVQLALFLPLLAIYSRFTSQVKAQGNTERRPVPLPKERVNVYEREETQVSNFSPPDSGNVTTAQLGQVLRKGMAKMEFRIEHAMEYEDTKCFALGVGGNFWLISNHSAPVEATQMRMSTQDSGGVRSKTEWFDFTPDMIFRDSEKELALLKIPHFPPSRSKLSFFTDNLPTKGSCCYLADSLEVSPFSTTHIETTDGSNLSLSGFRYVRREGTRHGLCGQPIFCDMGTSRAIIGIHVAGCGVDAFAAPITKSWLIKAKSFFPGEWLSEGKARDDMPEYPKPILSYVHPKAVVLEHEGSGIIRGTVEGRVHYSSLVAPSLASGFWRARGVASAYGPPVMRGVGPQKLALAEMVKPRMLNVQNLERVAEAYYADVVGKIPKDVLKEILHPYSKDVAINGVAEVAAVDSIPRSTSAGYPMNCSKRKFLVPSEPKEWAPNPVDVTPEIEREIELCIQTYLRRDLYHPVFTAALKDEPVSEKKQLSGKTRVFCGAPFPWSIVVRMKFLPIIRLMFNYREVFECGVGLTAQCREWHALADHIAKFGVDRVVAGDFKAFDKQMGSAIIAKAFDILIRLCREYGDYSEDDLLIMEGIKQDTAFPTVNFFGTVITFFGSNPSGHPLTVVINSIVNSFYMRLVYLLLGKDPTLFQENVSLMTYGDDNIMSSDDDDFNHTAIQRELGRLGIEYTMADKDAESKPFIHLSEATFLKRYFRWSPELDCVVGPLEMDSIRKMLCVIVASKTTSPEEQYSDILRSAQQEMFFWGPREFEEYTKMMYECIKECNLSNFFAGSAAPLTWGQFCSRFEKLSERAGYRDYFSDSLRDHLIVDTKDALVSWPELRSEPK